MSVTTIIFTQTKSGTKREREKERSPLTHRMEKNHYKQSFPINFTFGVFVNWSVS